MKPWRFVGLVLALFFCALTACGIQSYGQDNDKQLKPQDLKSKTELKEKVQDAIKEEKGDKKRASVTLQIDVPRDCKLIVNEKAVTYDKFEVLMEFASSAFTIEDMTYRSGQLTVLKMKAKE